MSFSKGMNRLTHDGQPRRTQMAREMGGMISLNGMSRYSNNMMHSREGLINEFREPINSNSRIPNEMVIGAEEISGDMEDVLINAS
ncbi:unnamed protein product [Gordionus sp. m RMFG-2023]